MTTYEAVVRPALVYASSIWSPPAPTAPCLTIQTENTTSITNIQHTLTPQTAIFNNGRYTTNIPTDPHTVTTTDIKQTCDIYIHLLSRHLTARRNREILRTPPPLISSSEVIPPRLTRRTIAKLITNKSPFLKSYLHKVDDKSHPSSLCSLCNTHPHNTYRLFKCTHTYAPRYHPWICGQTPRSNGIAGQIDEEASWWPTRWKIGLHH